MKYDSFKKLCAILVNLPPPLTMRSFTCFYHFHKNLKLFYWTEQSINRMHLTTNQTPPAISGPTCPCRSNLPVTFYCFYCRSDIRRRTRPPLRMSHHRRGAEHLLSVIIYQVNMTHITVIRRK